MNDFWNNVSRYPRFFISSLVGLILIILTPFRNLFKIRRFRLALLIFALSLVLLVANIIKSMTAI
jgi:hypothetical protein